MLYVTCYLIDPNTVSTRVQNIEYPVTSRPMRDGVLMLLALCACEAHARTVDLVADGGAVAGDSSLAAARRNGAAFNSTLAGLAPGDVLVVPANRTFHVMGGIVCRDKKGVTLSVDGTLVLSDDLEHWPRTGYVCPATCRVFDLLPCLSVSLCPSASLSLSLFLCLSLSLFLFLSLSLFLANRYRKYW